MTPRASAERLKAIEREAEKKAIETARYVIPIAAFTSMVHTISGITLHRLRRMAAAGDAPHEARLVIGEMVRLVKEIDPFFFEKVGLRRAAEATTCRRCSFPRTRVGGDAFARPSTRAWTAACRGWSTTSPDGGSESSPKRCASRFGLTPRRDGRRRGASTGC